jgi:hypothetical protein
VPHLYGKRKKRCVCTYGYNIYTKQYYIMNINKYINTMNIYICSNHV